jgi:hypothetical protein
MSMLQSVVRLTDRASESTPSAARTAVVKPYGNVTVDVDVIFEDDHEVRNGETYALFWVLIAGGLIVVVGISWRASSACYPSMKRRRHDYNALYHKIKDEPEYAMHQQKVHHVMLRLVGAQRKRSKHNANGGAQQMEGWEGEIYDNNNKKQRKIKTTRGLVGVGGAEGVEVGYLLESRGCEFCRVASGGEQIFASTNL